MTTAVLDHLWQSTAVALLAATLTLSLRHNSAASRYWLWFAASAQARVNKFGDFKSLQFTGVGSDGMDVYRATFANRELEWWIAPLVDGRVTWSGYAD